MFQDINLDNNQNRIDLPRKKVQQRISRSLFVKHYQNLNLVLNFKGVKKLHYIWCVLKRIDIAKKIFVLDIEQGVEVFINGDLSQDQYPLSFQYYDPIMLIIQ